MLEIICVIWLLTKNGDIAKSRGQKPLKYRCITLGLWFGLEIIGTIAGTLLSMALDPDKSPLVLAYAFGITGAIIGAVLSRQIVNRAPVGDYNPENTENQTSYNRPSYNQTYTTGTSYRSASAVPHSAEEELQSPATIHLVNEYYWNETTKDLFFLNGIPICTLQPGSEYTFETHSVKNTFTIGQPHLSVDDTDHCIRFIAADNGYVEIVIKDSKIATEKFKNQKSK